MEQKAKTKEKELIAFRKHKLFAGRIISFSKSGYRKAYPNNEVIFNSFIYTPKGRIVWYGDIDLTRSWKQVWKAMQDLGLKELHIQYENSGYQKEASMYIIRDNKLFNYVRVASNFTYRIF